VPTVNRAAHIGARTEGEGNYDAELHGAIEATGAAFVVLIVYDGRKGSGFGIGVDETRGAPSQRRILSEVPAILRAIADAIEEQQREMS
jgi:hypothetical protein